MHRVWQRFLAWLMILALVATSIPAVAAGPMATLSATDLHTRTEAVDRALAWLLSQQNDDGSFPAAFGSPASITLDVLLAGVAAGAEVSSWRAAAGRPSALEYLATQVDAFATDATSAGKLLAGIAAAGLDPRAFAGVDLVARVKSYADATGAFAPSALGQAWAMLGLLAAREPLPAGAADTLIALQQPDGGWESGPGWGTDSNTTALALQALAAAGLPVDHAALTQGLAYLAAQQSPTGGFTYSTAWGTTADANSTAYAVQALIALGQNPLGAAWRKGERSPLDDLLALQLTEGAFEWQAGTGANLLATAQAIPALLGKPLPLPGIIPAIRSALAYLRSVQQPDGGFAGGISASTQALMALSAAGENPRTWRGAGGVSLLDYLARRAGSSREAGTIGRLITALVLANENPYAFGGRNLLADLQGYYDAATGAYDAHGNIWNHSLALWGLAATGTPIPAEAIAWLRAQQQADGGWGWAIGQASDSNSTALVLQTLRACGAAPDDPAIQSAVTYLHAQQMPDGGFAYDASFAAETDANSTANVIQGLLAIGLDPERGWAWAQTLTSTQAITLTVRKPADALLALQRKDGAFEWQPGTGPNLLATVQAIPALAKITFPRRNPAPVAARQAIAWLKTQQNADGSFPAAFGSPVGVTLDVVLAAAAAGEDVAAWKTTPDGPSPLDYLATDLGPWNTNAANMGKFLTAIAAARQNPASFGGQNLVQLLLAYDDGTGAFGPSATDQAWAMIGLAATRYPIRPAVINALLALQQPDGGWESGPGWGTDSNTTALALQALAAAGLPGNHEAIQAAVAYLRAQQSPTGGFAYSTAWGTDADANSTAYGIQGLLAAGEDPAGAAWEKNGVSPLEDLLNFQLPSGAFAWQPGTGANLLATAQAVPALLFETLPLQVMPVGNLWLPLIGGRPAAS
jgi:prenyltransferase beta subunit